MRFIFIDKVGGARGTLFSSEYCPGGQYSRGDIIHSDNVTRTKLIKNGRHFGVQHRFVEKLACLSMEPRSYIEALGAELVGKEDEWTN